MSKVVSLTPREKIIKGFDIAADVVAGTLGPKGRNVLVDDALSPKFTNDGATIAQNVVLEDNQENAGAKILKNTCGQTLDDAGDGTTTSAVLVQAIVHEAIKRPENPMEIRESLLKELPKLVKEIKKQSLPIEVADINKVALISAEDPTLARNVSEIIQKIGKDAVITVEDSYDSDISYELVAGYEAHVGFMDPRFADPKDKKARCIMTDVPVLVTEKKIAAVSDIQHLWSKFAEKGISSCVIVCDDIETPILGVFLGNKLMGKFNAVVVRATGDLLKDIEAAVGATRVSDTTGVTFQNIDLKHLGKAKKVTIDANKSIFIADDPSKAEAYANHLEKFVDNEHNQFIKTRLQKRISQLRGGVAVLKIGSQDFNREYLKDKADDTIKACKAALEEGIVEGGGMCLWRIAQKMPNKTIGQQILRKALTAPLRKILENANVDYAEVVTKIGEYSGDGSVTKFGYNAKDNTYTDLVRDGVVDPAKVERCALENACSNAANFITMFASITDYVKPDTK